MASERCLTSVSAPAPMMHLRRHSKLAKYAKALVGEGVDQPSDQDDEVDQDDKVMLHLVQAYPNATVAFEADETGQAGASSMGYEAVMPHEEVRVVVFICCTRIHRTPTHAVPHT